MTPNILGYHSNSKDKSDRFVHENELVISNDLFYLGQGMYFWDNLSNANFWAKKKLKEENVREVYISTASLILEEPILDLTDRDTISSIRKMWLDYCRRTGESRVRQPFGVILNTLFAVLPETLGKIKVSKAHGDYSHYAKIKFFKELKRNSYLDDRPKTMYCVRCWSRIDNPQHLKIVA